jgi:hypothetical protein
MKCLNSLCFHLYSADLCQTSGLELWYSGGLVLGDLHHDTFFIVLIEPIHFCGYTIYLGSTADWTYVSFFYLITCAFVSFFSAEHERQTLMISFYVLGRFSPRHPRALFHILRIQRKHIVVKHIVVHWCNYSDIWTLHDTISWSVILLEEQNYDSVETLNWVFLEVLTCWFFFSLYFHTCSPVQQGKNTYCSNSSLTIGLCCAWLCYNMIPFDRLLRYSFL